MIHRDPGEHQELSARSVAAACGMLISSRVLRALAERVDPPELSRG